jgi:hypothetical protein
MRHHTTGLVLAALGALALTACGEKTETSTATSTATTAKTAAAAAADAPVARKAGLWEQTTNAEGMGSATMNICLGASVAPCEGAKVARTADGYTVSATCKRGATGSMTVDNVATGDLNSAYTLASKAVITDSAAPGKSQTVNATVKLRYLGPCPEGMSVGQIQSNEGAVIDMSNFDAAKARELAKQAGK